MMGPNCSLSCNGGKGKFVTGFGRRSRMAHALVIGAGTVGRACVGVLQQLGARVTVMDVNIGVLRMIGQQFHESVDTMISNHYNSTKILPTVDVVYNCVRWLKDAKEFMIDRKMVASMEKGFVIVDISNDYGAIETFDGAYPFHPTTSRRLCRRQSRQSSEPDRGRQKASADPA